MDHFHGGILSGKTVTPAPRLSPPGTRVQALRALVFEAPQTPCASTYGSVGLVACKGLPGHAPTNLLLAARGIGLGPGFGIEQCRRVKED